jgi:anti-anti-sigma regulatory factor
MFKISIVEERSQRRLLLEGKLIRPWTEEVESTWRKARQELNGRKLVVDLRNVTFISADGESTLFKLMSGGAKFSCKDVLTKHVLKQLARRCSANDYFMQGQEEKCL